MPVLLLGVVGAAAGVLTLPAGSDGNTSTLRSGGASGVTALGPTARAAIPTRGPLLNLSASRDHELAFVDATAAQGPAPATAGASRVVVVPPPASTSPLARSRGEAPALASPRTTADGRQVLGSKAALLAAAAAPPVVAPVVGPISSPFGYRWGRLHAGLDFVVPVGSPVVAARDGVVQRTSSSRGGYGNLTVLEHADGTLTYYAHQSAILVTDGQVVTAGELIGQSGNTGHSTGPHLHFEVRPGGGDAVDPRTWLAEQGVPL